MVVSEIIKIIFREFLDTLKLRSIASFVVNLHKQILQIIFFKILGSLTWLVAVLKKELKISLNHAEGYLNFKFIKLAFVLQCAHTELAKLRLLECLYWYVVIGVVMS